jgi:hypothetical protein
MSRILWYCLPAALLFVLLPGVAAAKTAAGPKCGATIKTSIKLHANLNCSAGGTNGLNVGKNGIVIDLNGYTITGSGGSTGYDGIYNNGYHNVTVTNGTIKQFDHGYLSVAAVGETVTHVHVVDVKTGNLYYSGLDISSGSGGTYAYDTVKNAYIGVSTYLAVGAKFSHNTLTGNGFGASESSSHGSNWTSNNFSHSKYPGYVDGNGSTILTGNISSYNGGYGFQLSCDGYGIATVKNNTANYNANHGILSMCAALNGHKSTFSGNTTSHNAGFGISSNYDTQATFSGNIADANSLGGFYFTDPLNCVITLNTSNGNINSDGMFFQTDNSYFPAKVAKNSSSNNGYYGYNADHPVTGSGDTGSNNAAGLFNNVSG